MKRSIIMTIVAIIIMAETANADFFNNRFDGSNHGSRGCQNYDTLDNFFYGGGYQYSTYRSHPRRSQPNIVHDAETGITTYEQASLWEMLFGSGHGKRSLRISEKERQDQQSPPPTLREMEAIAEKAKADRAEKMRRAAEERVRLEELELRRMELEIERLKLQKELERVQSPPQNQKVLKMEPVQE